jgi:LacI family transcriptional regulator
VRRPDGDNRSIGAVTLRDVAVRAGVHTSTASRALNERTRSLVNEGTVSRVIEAARQLGYMPNSLARGLKTNRTFTVGMLVPDLTNPLFPPIVRGIEDRLARDDYTLVVANTDNDPERERRLASTMLNRRVDGLVLATARRHYPLLDELLASGAPVVLVNRVVDDSHVSSVSGDDHAGIGLAVRHLVSLGHRRIAHIAGGQDTSTGLARYHSFVAWMQSSGLPIDRDLLVVADWFQEAPGADAFAELLDRGVEFTAAVAANDLIALGCYDVMAARGMRCPEDISIVGYNDIPFSDKFSPPLTTVHIPHYRIGVKAADLLLDALEDPLAEPVAVRLAPSLVERGSTARPR